MFALYYRQLTILVLGFASGLPLALCASTLQAWYAVSGLDVVAISSLALVGQPYMLKFLWAPLLDRAVPFNLGRRRVWMIVSQLGIILVLLAMSFQDPLSHPFLLGLLALLLAFASATQDVAIDAYRADLLPPSERGLGAAMTVGGYRTGMLVSGGLALILADYMGWAAVYRLMAVAMGMCSVATLCAPSLPRHAAPPQSLSEAIRLPLREFFSRAHAFEFILLIILFKLGEAFTSSAGVMTNTFLLQGLGFSLATVGKVNKIVGFGAILFGIFLGGLLLRRISIYTALISFGLLHAVSNLSYALLAAVGQDYNLLIFAVVFENIAAGLSNAAIIALLMSLCDARYSATQYALLSAIAISGRVLLGPVAGVMVATVGWFQFFLWTFFLALPGVWLAWWMKQRGISSLFHPESPDQSISVDS